MHSYDPDKILEHAERLSTLALELTMLTGEVVTSAVTDWHCDELIFPEGIIHAELSQNRWTFSPARPKSTPHNYTAGPAYERISASATRPPEAIARDLLRRCYPAALEYWQEWERLTTKHAAEVAQVNAHVATLEAAGMRRSTHSGSETRATMYGSSTEADLHDAGLYSFKITTLTIEQAVKILEILNEE